MFDNQGSISEVDVENGKTVLAPNAKKDGYVFVGWFESGASSKFDFSKPITRDVELLAVFEQAVEVKPEENASVNDKAGAQALSDVIEAAQKQEMSEEVAAELDPVVAAALEDAIANDKLITR